ncbi:MAG: hypothetical protein ACI93R_003942 [Flavobacteriales bacterium]|jgi:hypothetical protein
MEIVPFIGLGIVLVLLPLALCVGLLFLILRKVKYGQYISSALALGSAFLVITAIWPMNSFYVDEFENNSGIAIKVKNVLYKDSSYPDMHGDYFSLAVFKVKSVDLLKLKSDLVESELDVCKTPRLVVEFLNGSDEQARCWSINRNVDEWFDFYYYKNTGILYYRFNQT